MFAAVKTIYNADTRSVFQMWSPIFWVLSLSSKQKSGGSVCASLSIFFSFKCGFRQK